MDEAVLNYEKADNNLNKQRNVFKRQSRKPFVMMMLVVTVNAGGGDDE
jgi:hypothetical protein